MNNVICGALILGYWAIGLAFARFWKTSQDRFFAFFAYAFWLLAVERIFLIWVSFENEMRPYLYGIRLVAFLLIICGIVDKNRRAVPPPGHG